MSVGRRKQKQSNKKKTLEKKKSLLSSTLQLEMSEASSSTDSKPAPALRAMGRSKSMIVPGGLPPSASSSSEPGKALSKPSSSLASHSADNVSVPVPARGVTKAPAAASGSSSTTAKEKESNKEVHIRVAIRCRPLNEEEKKTNQSSVVSCDLESNTVKVLYGTAAKKLTRTLEFDKVFGMYSRQAEVYDSMVKPIVEEAIQGFNCTVFAYGPTGTGKTHTMSGELGEEELWGMVPRAAKTIFDSSVNSDRTVKVSYLEICKSNLHISQVLVCDGLIPLSLSLSRFFFLSLSFPLCPSLSLSLSLTLSLSIYLFLFTDNEELSDLLAGSTDRRLKLMEDAKRGVICHNLEEFTARSLEELLDLLRKGLQNRATASTLSNHNSSRSHAIFTMRVLSKEVNEDGQEVVKSGQLNLVDLAG
jgi:kinesin family protein 11